MAEIEFKDVTKRYGDGYEAVKHLSLDIPDHELMILVGPSGCGKSTALRMVAGLEDITEGELKIGGQVVNDRAPKDRDIAMVFQNYALYPHMTVRENMGFALKLAKTPQAEIDKKVGDAAQILDLEQHLDRKPANLSGGQRQRVAMGRAIVRDPSVFLMDEPLSNLDAKLRVQMRTEISRIQQRLGTTTIYVTHDQTEAMTLGDRIAVMRAGILQQVGAAVGALRPPDEPVRRGLHRLAVDELPARRDRRRPAEAAHRRRADRGRARVAAVIRVRRRAPRRDRGPAARGLRGRRARRRAGGGTGRPSRRRSTCWSRWDPSTTPTSSSRPIASPPASSTSWRRNPAPPTFRIGAGCQVVARLDAASQARQGQEMELGFNTAHIKLFHPEAGQSLLGAPDACELDGAQPAAPPAPTTAS